MVNEAGSGLSEYSEVERGAVEEDMSSAFRIAFWLDAAGHGRGRTCTADWWRCSAAPALRARNRPAEAETPRYHLPTKYFARLVERLFYVFRSASSFIAQIAWILNRRLKASKGRQSLPSDLVEPRQGTSRDTIQMPPRKQARKGGLQSSAQGGSKRKRPVVNDTGHSSAGEESEAATVFLDDGCELD